MKISGVVTFFYLNMEDTFYFHDFLYYDLYDVVYKVRISITAVVSSYSKTIIAPRMSPYTPKRRC